MANLPSHSSMAYATLPLPQRYAFASHEFDRLAAYARSQAKDQSHNQSPFCVAPIVVAYATASQRNAAIAGALEDDKPQYEAGRVAGSATRYYPARQGGVGMVASPLQNAVGNANDWHTVGVFRKGHTVWVHDPGYQPRSQTRLPMIPGTSNVTRLLDSSGFGTVNMVQVQGFGSTNLDCMSRSAQWVDNMISAPAASQTYPLDTFMSGHVTSGWEKIQRR